MFGKVGTFLTETKQELNKVSWPTRDEVWQATIVVIFTTFLIAFYIGVIDFFLSGFMRLLIG